MLASVGGREDAQEVRDSTKKLTVCEDTGNCETTGNLAGVGNDSH